MISQREYINLTRVYPVLDQLPADLQEDIQREGFELKLLPGEPLLSAGSSCQLLPLITSGTVRVVMPIRSGRELTLYRLQPGQVCYLMASCLLAGSRYPGRLFVESRLAGVWLPKEIFCLLIERSVPFRSFVFSFFNSQLVTILNLIEDIFTKPLEQRLADVLLQKGLVIRTTHQMLANEVGTVREVVSRILKDFEARDIITIGRGTIWVKDQGVLSQIANIQGDLDH